MDGGQEITVDPDVAFTASSTIKIPILVSYFIQHGTEPVPEDVNRKILNMIHKSDNVASDDVMAELSPETGPLIVTEYLKKLGLTNTFMAGFFAPGSPLLQRFTTQSNQRADVFTDPDIYNQTTASEMGILLEDIYQCAETDGGALVAAFPGQDECRRLQADHRVPGRRQDRCAAGGGRTGGDTGCSQAWMGPRSRRGRPQFQRRGHHLHARRQLRLKHLRPSSRAARFRRCQPALRKPDPGRIQLLQYVALVAWLEDIRVRLRPQNVDPRRRRGLIEYNRCMSAALSLLRLQQVDSRIDHLEAELGHITSELDDNSLAAAARQALKSAEDEQAQAEAGRLGAEGLATVLRNKLQQAEASLYGGTVRNPKELQDLQAEVASLKKHLITLDADEIAWMEKLEVADASIRDARAHLESVLLGSESEHGQLRERQSELLVAKESLLSERAATADAVKIDWRKIYDGLRQTRRGVAVAAVEDGACAACGTALTPAMQQNVRHAQDLVHCPSCSRILYAD